MKKRFDKFIYKKMQFETETSIRMMWYLIHKERREGVHFHGYWNKNKDKHGYDFNENNYGFSAHGIEAHRKSPHYEGAKPIEGCDVTGGDCYPDGSSLQASEQLGHINPDGSDDNYIWFVLHDYYGYWIDKHWDDAAPPHEQEM